MVIDEWCEVFGKGSLGALRAVGGGEEGGERTKRRGWEGEGARYRRRGLGEEGRMRRKEVSVILCGYKSREVMCSCTFCLEAVSVSVTK